MNPDPVVIAGPTGTGKSDLALRLASALSGEIVNYDSVQIYRGFDIGSAKPTVEMRRRVPHHLFDIVEATEQFSAADYERAATTTCDDIVARGRLPLFVGGTFFYLRAFLSGLPEMPTRDEAIRERIRRISSSERGQDRLHAWLSKVDPQSGRKIAPRDRHRVERALEVWMVSGRPISTWQRPEHDGARRAVRVGLRLDRALLVQRLDARVAAMYDAGLVDETRALLDRYPRDARPFGSIGYREAVAVIDGSSTLEEAVAETRRRTRAYAKRQMTWLRSEQNVQWIDAADPDTMFASALEIIEERA